MRDPSSPINVLARAPHPFLDIHVDQLLAVYSTLSLDPGTIVCLVLSPRPSSLALFIHARCCPHASSLVMPSGHFLRLHVPPWAHFPPWGHVFARQAEVYWLNFILIICSFVSSLHKRDRQRALQADLVPLPFTQTARLLYNLAGGTGTAARLQHDLRYIVAMHSPYSIRTHVNSHV